MIDNRDAYTRFMSGLDPNEVAPESD
jgi:hypothetical protein